MKLFKNTDESLLGNSLDLTMLQYSFLSIFRTFKLLLIANLIYIISWSKIIIKSVL